MFESFNVIKIAEASRDSFSEPHIYDASLNPNCKVQRPSLVLWAKILRYRNCLKLCLNWERAHPHNDIFSDLAVVLFWGLSRKIKLTFFLKHLSGCHCRVSFWGFANRSCNLFLTNIVNWISIWKVEFAQAIYDKYEKDVMISSHERTRVSDIC